MSENRSFADKIKSTQIALKERQNEERETEKQRHNEQQRELAEQKALLGPIISRVLLPVAEEFVKMIDGASGPHLPAQDEYASGCIFCNVAFDGIASGFTIKTVASVDKHGQLTVRCSTTKRNDTGSITRDTRFSLPIKDPATPDDEIRGNYESILESQWSTLCNKVKERMVS